MSAESEETKSNTAEEAKKTSATKTVPKAAASESSKNMVNNTAKASGVALPISSKHAIEICRMIRGMNVSKAKTALEEVAEIKRAVPFKRFYKNVGHRKGSIGPGRFPVNAAKHILFVLESAEANALFKGMDSSALIIQGSVANRASRPIRSGRRGRGKAKRTHVEIIVAEIQQEKTVKSVKQNKPLKKKNE